MTHLTGDTCWQLELGSYSFRGNLEGVVSQAEQVAGFVRDPDLIGLVDRGILREVLTAEDPVGVGRYKPEQIKRLLQEGMMFTTLNRKLILTPLGAKVVREWHDGT